MYGYKRLVIPSGTRQIEPFFQPYLSFKTLNEYLVGTIEFSCFSTCFKKLQSVRSLHFMTSVLLIARLTAVMVIYGS